MIKIPHEFLPQNKWTSSQGSDLFGDVIKTKNVDFNEDGYITLAKKATAIYTEHTGVSNTGDPDFQDVVAICSDATVYFIATIDHCFTLTVSETGITDAEVSTGSQPAINEVCDAVTYKGLFAVTGATTLDYYTLSGDTWTNASAYSLSADYPHPLCVFQNRRSLCIANGNVVYQTATDAWTDNSTDRLTLPSDHVVTSMRWRGNNLYIGTRTLNGANAMMFVWNGRGTEAQSGYPVDADWVYSMCEYDSSVAILTSTGQLRRFNGGGFSELANLPVYYTPFSWSEKAGTAGVGKAINRSMFVLGDTIYLTIQGEPRGLFSPGANKQPGGLWCYEPSVGLYHKAGFNTEPYLELSISTLASSIFTFSTAHGVETGDPVYALSVTNISQLVAGVVYYAIKINATQIYLARSIADAEANRFITCSGTISGDKLAVDVLDTMGNTLNCIPGAVAGFNKNQMSRFFANEVLFSGTAKDPSNTNICSLMSFGATRNVGYFVTPKLYGAGITEAIQKLYMFIRGMNNDLNKIVIKYRTTERAGLPTPAVVVSAGVATWVDTTSFTILTTGKDVKSAQVGDEVEIVQGAGAGYSAHISAINDATSTYTYTLDEAIPNISANDVSDVFIDNWTKLGEITKDSNTIDQGFHGQEIGGASAWVQFKIEMRGTDLSINVLKFINEISKPTA
jgi:hypothetical protein